MTILILGGTAEARALAAALVSAGRPVISSLAGRVSNPAVPAGEVRIGGFGGVDGLAEYLVQHKISQLVDATHPFAAKISANAVAAAARTGVPLVRLVRPGWRDHPDANRWTWVDSAEGALRQARGAVFGSAQGAVGRPARRPFLTTGRQGLAEFLPWRERRVLVRVVDPPEFELPAAWTLIRSRGPYDFDKEHALMRDQGVDLLVSKESGGTYTSAKLDAAANLGIDVVMISRPAGSTTALSVSSVAEALTRLGVG